MTVVGYTMTAVVWPVSVSYTTMTVVVIVGVAWQLWWCYAMTVLSL
jgi:hypothetical protein